MHLLVRSFTVTHIYLCLGDDPQELAEAATSQAHSSRGRRLPKGTSEYQAAWILDDEGDEGDYEDVDDPDPDSHHPGQHASNPASYAFSELADGDAYMGEDEDGDEGTFGSEVRLLIE